MKAEGVVDRISDHGLAVILVEQLKKQFEVPINQFPDMKSGDWLYVTIENDEITDIEVNTEKTKERKRIAKEKTDRLRKRKQSNYKR